MKIHIWYMQQFGNWVHYQTKYNEKDAYRVAKRRAQATGKRHKLTDDTGTLIDLIN